jgi:hypothetical protein
MNVCRICWIAIDAKCVVICVKWMNLEFLKNLWLFQHFTVMSLTLKRSK